MVLTSNARYQTPIGTWVAEATGDLVCPVCQYAQTDIHEISYWETISEIAIYSILKSRPRLSFWYLTEDLAFVCSQDCLNIHNVLGGLYIK